MGARWLELEPQHTDPAYVLWATAKLVDLSELDPGGLTVRVELSDTRSTYWLMLRQPYPEVCTTAQGREEDVIVRSDSATLARIHLRHLTVAAAERAALVTIDGLSRARRAFLTALRPSPFAHVRPARRRVLRV